MSKRLLALLLSASLSLAAIPSARADVYDGHPKLVVIVVIDQFRADYLQRYRSEFKGRGFRLFLDKGAYFPDCYFGYANTKTAPGHATLGTGAYTDGHGINSNEWWDLTRNKDRPVTSVEDDRYTLVEPTAAPAGSATATPTAVQQEEANSAGAPAQTPAPAPPTVAAAPASTKPQPGDSPRNLLASTIGDELRLATDGASRVYGVSLKDRAAILPAGASANGAFWIDSTSGRFITSSYYMTALPQWADDFDNGPAIQQAASDAGVAGLTNFYSQVGVTNAANTYEIAFSEALITGEQLGSHATTDLLTLSLSPNDIEGHHYGPDSPEEHTMVLGLDTDLDAFFSWLDTHVPGGLANVVLALSADHGIAPTPAVSAGLGLPGAYISTEKLTADLNQAMNAKFSPGENVVYILPQQELPYLSLNQPMFERAGINEQEAEDAVKAAMGPAFQALDAQASAVAAKAPQQAAPPAQAAATPPITDTTATPPTPAPTGPGATNTAGAIDSPPAPPPARVPPVPELFRSYTRMQLAAGEVPPTEFGRLLAHSYSPNGSWYVAVFPIAFQMEGYGSGGTTHYTPYSYDRHVPLGFYGGPFVPGTYRGRVEPVDLASTLASILDVNQPSASVGLILTQALKPAAEFPYPKEPITHRLRLHRAAHTPAEPAAPAAPAPK
jgi:predicted AlkP superfamily pyrophosphatase or phosphodiesterase